MKIYIDVSVLTLATFITGVQRVVREVCLRIADDPTAEEVFLQYNALKDCYYKIDSKLFVDFYRTGQGVKEHMVTNEKVEISGIGEGCVFFDIDAAWLDRMRRSYLLPLLKQQGAKVVCFLHDVIAVTHPQFCIERTAFQLMDFFGAHLQHADLVITTTNATAKEVRSLCERIYAKVPRIEVVPLGSDFKAPTAEALEEGTRVPGLAEAMSSKYLLMVGTVEPRKNHKLVLDAYDKYLKDKGYHLILAGYLGWNMEDFAQRLHSHPDFGKGIWHFEGLSDADIHRLYLDARFLVFASYIEGYGLPVVEAVQRGTPVLCADEPVLREVGGDYCDYFTQDDAKSLADKVLFYEENPDAYDQMKNRLGEAHFTNWEESYAGDIAAIRSLEKEA